MKTMLKLALPVVGSYLGLMLMQLVDLLAVGRVSATAIGAVGLGNSVFSWALIFGIGLLAGLDYLVAHSHGAGQGRRGYEALVQGLWLSVALAVPLTLGLVLIADHLAVFGVNAAVEPEARAYLKVLALSLFPAWGFTALRQYLQAIDRPGPGLAVMAGANVLNALANYAFVFGEWGFPAMGATGSAYATLISRTVMLVAIAAWAWGIDARGGGYVRAVSARLHWERLRELVRLGLPAAMQMTFEVGVFALATALAARLVPAQLAAHQLVLNTASLAFMVPLGLGSATAVLVGQAMGRGDPREASRMGSLGIALAGGFMACSCVVMLAFPDAILRAYTSDAEVIAAGKAVLLVAALFQLSDGIQASVTGALRGLGETRSPAVANLVGHWAVGLPVGYYLCFVSDRGLQGLWVGLSLGLTLIAAALLWVWRRESRARVAALRLL